jgi:hypothetical protein
LNLRGKFGFELFVVFINFAQANSELTM